MGRKHWNITAVLHLPESEAAVGRFEKTLCDFYAAQVEKKLRASGLTKQEKQEVISLLLTD